MSKLKHYKGDGWEVKVKYDEETEQLLWTDNKKICIVNMFKFCQYLTVNEIIKIMKDAPVGSVHCSKKDYNWFTEHLDNLTAPKIINEHTFDNDNFKIRIWETEDKIGGETLWVREGFEYDNQKKEFHITIGNINKSALFGDLSKLRHFRVREEGEIKYFKYELKYTYTDLYKALVRAEQETSELTYDTVVKELEGLDTKETLLALQGYEYCKTYVHITGELGQSSWANVGADGFNLFAHKELIERGLIKLRRAK